MGGGPFWDGLVAGYGIAIPVGAIAVLILDLALRRGFADGFFAGAGAAAADTAYAGLAVAAGAALAPRLQPYALPLALASGTFLLGLGAHGAWRARRGLAAPTPHAAPPSGRLAIFSQFLGLTLLNPLTIVYFAALILGGQGTSGWTAAEAALFVVGAGVASLSWQSLLAAFGAFLGRRLPPRLQQAASLIGNLVVVVLGLRILLAALGG
jgi:threonine/homoserine/homoserine lactone efflux protein